MKLIITLTHELDMDSSRPFTQAELDLMLAQCMEEVSSHFMLPDEEDGDEVPVFIDNTEGEIRVED